MKMSKEKSKEQLKEFMQELSIDVVRQSIKELNTDNPLVEAVKSWECYYMTNCFTELLVTFRIILEEGERDALMLAKTFLTDRLIKVWNKEQRRAGDWNKVIMLDRGDSLDYRKFNVEMELYSNVLIYFNEYTKDNKEFQDLWKTLYMKCAIYTPKDALSMEYLYEAVNCYETALETIKEEKVLKD